jgi:hypothetical protein
MLPIFQKAITTTHQVIMFLLFPIAVEISQRKPGQQAREEVFEMVRTMLGQELALLASPGSKCNWD